jgi:hypothetical protein
MSIVVKCKRIYLRSFLHEIVEAREGINILMMMIMIMAINDEDEDDIATNKKSKAIPVTGRLCGLVIRVLRY